MLDEIQVNDFLLDDLEIFTKIFPLINLTTTQYGANCLRNKLRWLSVSTAPDLITMTKYICTTDNYRNKMENALIFINSKQSAINEWIYGMCDSDLHFVGYSESFNNEFSLNLTNRMKFSNVVILIIFYLVMYVFFNMTGMEISIPNYLLSLVKGYYYVASLILSVFIGNETIVDWVSKGLTFLYIAYNFYSLYQTVISCINHYKKCNEFKETYYTMIKIIDKCKYIWDQDMFREIILPTERLSSIDNSFKKLYKLFGDEESLGSMIVTKLTCYEYENHLTNILNYIGHVDMIISNSKLLNMGYSSPHIDMSYDKPFIILNDVWNPLLSYNKQIKNSCTIGLNEHQNMIITGPNRAGKSTFIRSSVLSIYLAQTLGVTCAKELYFTPFNEIFTYLNVPDIVGKESLFEAELERCYKYYSKVNQSNKNNKVLGIIDELFTGTNYFEGMAGSYAVIKKIVESEYSVTIMTTHFHEICNIPNIIYKQFCAIINNDTKKHGSKFNFSYKIKNGISNQCIALDLLSEKGYGNEIVKIAKEKLNGVLNKK